MCQDNHVLTKDTEADCMRHSIFHKFISKLLNSPNSKGGYNYHFDIIKSKFIERACETDNLNLLKYFIITKEYHVYQPLFYGW